MENLQDIEYRYGQIGAMTFDQRFSVEDPMVKSYDEQLYVHHTNY
jgi:hypothetical protein